MSSSSASSATSVLQDLTMSHVGCAPGDTDSRHGEASNYLIPWLPEDIWCHIHSLMPMSDAARAACLSRVFLHSWRCHPNLTLTWAILCPHGLELGQNIDRILRNHSGIGLKTLELNLDGRDSLLPYVDSWLQVAIKPGLEMLILLLHKKYKFPCSLLSEGVRNSIRGLQLYACVFRPTSELGPLRRLTSLDLSFVRITGDELDCLLSNSLALEQLELYICKEIIFLKIPCVLQQLSRLTVIDCYRLQAMERNAPNLSIVFFSGRNIKLSLGQLMKMKELYMHQPDVVCYARAELPSIMPNLETLVIGAGIEMVNVPMVLTKFLYLKHLTIEIWERTFSPPYDYFPLVSFFDASPALETFFMNVPLEDVKHESVFGASSYLRELPEHQHNCLKVVEITGFSSAKSLVELTCCIVKNAVSLECITLDTLRDRVRCYGEGNETCQPISNAVLKEASRTVMAITMYIEDKVAPTCKLTVLEPCTRCHCR
ncbi:unnamed protein product [Urochloa decumbens]|uniref:At1g61320/AtMIF1 LRR domain-containing protein n=1 Tax=Urochloa decumbens TaxID=240449 RepID=A0ABC9EW46_9POAL